MRKLTAVLFGLVLSLAVATGTASAAPGPAAASPQTTNCTYVTQYTVTAYGELTDAESGGSFVGYGYAGDIFNVRQTGYPRYYGAIAATGKFGWFLSSKLAYRGTACV
jgi:hypothetical protein